MIFQFNFSTLKIIIAIIVSYVQGAQEKNPFLEYISHLQLIHANDWNAQVSCPMGSYISAIKPRIAIIKMDEAAQPFTVVTGLNTTCTNKQQQKETSSLTNFGRYRGYWGQVEDCSSGYAIGIYAILTPIKNSIASILEVHLHCPGSLEERRFRSGDYEEEGESTSMIVMPNENRKFFHFCPEGQALSGLRLYADSIVTYFAGDLSSLKALMVHCRKIQTPPLSRAFTLKLSWERLHNIQCKHPSISFLNSIQQKQQSEPVKTNDALSCTFESWTGIKPTQKARNSVMLMNQIEPHLEIPLNLKQEIEKRLRNPSVATWFKTKISSRDGPTPVDEFLDSGGMDKDPQIYLGNLTKIPTKPPIPSKLFAKFRNSKTGVFKHTAVVDQLTADCGQYKVAFNLFKSTHELYIDQKINNRLTRIVFEIA